MGHGRKWRVPGARGKAAGVLALAGAAVLGYVFLQPAGSADIPGWTPVNAQVAEALGDAEGGGKPAASGASATAEPGTANAGGTGASGAAAAGGQAVNAPAAGGQPSSGATSPDGTSAGLAPSGGAGLGGTPAGQASSGVSGSAATSAGQVAAGVPGQSGSPAAPNAAGAGPAADTSGRLNLNTATAEQLDALKGIGPSKAQAIVAYRERQGPFRSVDDLLNVKGIGPKLLDGIRADVTV